MCATSIYNNVVFFSLSEVEFYSVSFKIFKKISKNLILKYTSYSTGTKMFDVV